VRIRDLITESHDRAKRKGFHDHDPSIDQCLCRLHSEVSEAWEATRDGALTTMVNPETGKPEGLPSELADAVIVICDLAGKLGIDLEREIRLKSDFNETRPARHGRNF
jgi:NTP pyrophosphatase (non-canonical NTP hydrolase)